MAPRVSFIVPCYKYAHFLPTCLDSILAQSFQDFEVLILDDCSPDSTSDIVARYTDPRIRYIRQPKNLGLPGNLNVGVPHAKGELFWLISADDAVYDNVALAHAVQLFDNHPDAGIVWSVGIRLNGAQERLTSFAHWEEQREFARLELAPALAEKCLICTPAALVRSTVYRAAGEFPVTIPYIGDWYLWLRCSLLSGAIYTPKPLARYRLHEDNMTAAFTQKSMDRFMRESLIYRIWLLRLQAEYPAVAERARVLANYDFRCFFQTWVQTKQSHDVVIPFLRDVQYCADGLTSFGAPASQSLRACLNDVASELIADLWGKRRLKSTWRAWRLRAALDRVLSR